MKKIERSTISSSSSPRQRLRLASANELSRGRSAHGCRIAAEYLSVEHPGLPTGTKCGERDRLPGRRGASISCRDEPQTWENDLKEIETRLCLFDNSKPLPKSSSAET